MLNASERALAISGIVLAVLLVAMRCEAGIYEYRGVYTAQAVFTNLCENCFLELPPEFMETKLTLSVNTDKEKELNRALVAGAKSAGWNLSKRGNVWKAEPVQNDGNVVFISCMNNEPVNVPKYLYAYALKSDSIKCAERERLRREQDSITLFEKHRNDSLAKIRLGFGHYHLRYFSYSKSFTDKMGIEWNSILLSGNLHDRFEYFDDWKLVANEINDTSYTERGLVFSVDTSLNVDWGSEEQTLKQTFVNDGVTTSDYEWRKYGLIVSVRRDGQRVRMDYTFRDKDNSVSVLQGSVIGDEGDTLRLFGTYTSHRNVQNGIPFLCRLPIIGYLFATNTTTNDIRAFELYLLPIKKDERNGYGRIEKSRTPTWTGYGQGNETDTTRVE